VTGDAAQWNLPLGEAARRARMPGRKHGHLLQQQTAVSADTEDSCEKQGRLTYAGTG